jgi:hypothetical protein
VLDSRPLLLSLAIEAAPLRVPPLARFAHRRSAYVATLVVKPEDYQPAALYETGTGVDVLWQFCGVPRLEGG